MKEAVEQCLLKGGWSRHRRIPIHHWGYWLGRFGLSIVPPAESILQNLGGLFVSPVLLPERKYAPGPVFFDPTYEFGKYTTIRLYERHVGRKLTPLAVCDVDFDGTFVVSEDGVFYEEHDRAFYELGNSLDEALDRLLCGGASAIGEPFDTDQLQVLSGKELGGMKVIHLDPWADPDTGVRTEKAAEANRAIHRLYKRFFYLPE